MKRVATLLLGCLLLVAGGSPTGAADNAAETWKVEFDQLCGQTDSAASLSSAELKQVIARCTALQAQIERLEATPRKVYLKRLQMCRNLFVYLLEGKEKEAGNR